MAQYNRDYSSSRDGEWNIVYIIVGAIALLLLVGLAVGWFATDQNEGMLSQETTEGTLDNTLGMDLQSQQQTQQPQTQPGSSAVGGGDVSIGSINDDPENFVGNSVYMTGTLTSYESDNAFMVSDGAMGQDILVVHSENTLGASMPQIDENQRVEVQGVVRMLDRGALEQELGIEMFDGVFEGLDGSQPVIVARQIRPVQ